MRELRLERSSTLLARAAQVVRDRLAGQASAVLIYGYSDATGLAIDFIQSLLQVFGGRFYLDRPPDPAAPDQTDVGAVFSRNFTERLISSISDRHEDNEKSGPFHVKMFKALGGDAEVRETGLRIRRLLDGGAEPESIGVAARALEPYRESIRTQFTRLGIPFSGIGASGPGDPSTYRARAVLDLLRQHARAPVERWIESRDPGALAAPGFDLRLAFHTLGAGRLEEAGNVRVTEIAHRGFLKLPVCSGLSATEPEEEDRRRRTFAKMRRVPQDALAAEVRKAKDVLRLLAPKRTGRTSREHLERLDSLLTNELDWDPQETVTAELIDSANSAVRGLPPDFSLSDDEFLDLLREAWAENRPTPLGGKGGGVQILDVIEARSRTFDHLFLPGRKSTTSTVFRRPLPWSSGFAGRASVRGTIPGKTPRPLKRCSRPDLRFNNSKDSGQPTSRRFLQVCSETARGTDFATTWSWHSRNRPVSAVE
jgi:hypothetical protein